MKYDQKILFMTFRDTTPHQRSPRPPLHIFWVHLCKAWSMILPLLERLLQSDVLRVSNVPIVPLLVVVTVVFVLSLQDICDKWKFENKSHSAWLKMWLSRGAALNDIQYVIFKKSIWEPAIAHLEEQPSPYVYVLSPWILVESRIRPSEHVSVNRHRS